jgi:hypothetical protein
VWHLLYLIPALLFLVYWFAKPLMPRLIALIGGRRTPDELVTKRDVKVSVALGLVVLGITAASMVYSSIKWPDTLPLQVQNVATPAGNTVTGTVVAELPEGRATYHNATDTLGVTVRFHNLGATPVELSYLEIGNHIFDTDPATNTGATLASDQPLTLGPGEQRDLKLQLTSIAFHDNAVIPGAEVTSVIGSLAVFKQGNAEAHTVSELNLPVFKDQVAP